MLKSLLLFFSLGMALQASAACTAISSWPTNPSTGQSVSFSLSGCNSSCYSTCLAYHAYWNVSCQGSFVVNGTTYYNSATFTGTNLNVVFNSNTSVTVTFSTQGRCNSPCNGYLTKTFRVGPPPPPPAITRPSTSLVPSSLTSVWETAGADKSLLPAVRECINIHNESGIVTRHEDGYKVNIDNLNSLINNNNSTGGTRVIYFQEAKYYFDKGKTININRNNLILSGEGADKTEFFVEDISTPKEDDAINFIRISGRTRVGVACLSINTSGAFKSSYYHNNLRNGKFNAASIINISNSNNCWVSGVQVYRGYGNTVQISRGRNNEVTNCLFFDHWTLGGVLGTGVQGYGVNISKSDNNLIENNSIGLSRHNIIIQGNSTEGSTADGDISNGNVVAYNYLYLAIAFHSSGTTIQPSWNITFHGGGKNRDNLIEGNVCEDKIAVDDVKKSNGEDNVFYRNLSKTQIEIEKGGSCHNRGQIYLGNIVYKRGLTDRYRIRGEDHLVVGNKKCNSSGGSCTTGTFNVGDKCGWFSGQNKNRSLNSGETLGQSCYLTAIPDFLNFLPVSNPDNVIPAKHFTTAPVEGCFTCPNVILPPRIIIGPGDPKDPKEPGDIAIKKGQENNKPATTELNQTEEVVAIAFPNPTAEVVTIQLKGATITTPVVFQLHNVAGQLVGTTRVTLEEQNSFEYNVSALPRGIYIGTLIAEEQIYSVKIVKE